jgi:hypothetical protein
VADVTDRRRFPDYVSPMSAYETVTILVVVGTVLIGALSFLRHGGPLAQLGRQGSLWFDHLADWTIAERPSEDQLDAPIPRPPLRGRLD